MANVFDQFDAIPAAQGGNPFDRFDAAPVPLETGVIPATRIAEGWEMFPARKPGWEAGNIDTARDELRVRLQAEQANPYGFQRGMTGFLNDEIAGATEAVGGTVGRLLSGEAPNLADDYARGAEREREARARYEHENPIASTAASVTGGMMVGPGTFVKNAGGLLSRSLAAGAENAAIGGVGGFLEGEGVTDRLRQAGVGAAVGGGVGLAAPAVISGVGAAVRGVGRAASPITQPIANRITPDDRATMLVRQALERDGLTAQDVATRMSAMRTSSPDAVLADVGGANVRGLARTAVNTPGAGREAVESFVNARRLDQGNRITDAIRGYIANADDFGRATERLIAEREHIAGPLYEAARRNAKPVDVSGVVKYIDNQIRPGVNSLVNPGSDLADPNSIAGTLSRLRQVLATGTNQRVDLASLHAFKMELDDMIGRAVRSGSGNQARSLMGVKTRLLKAMDAASPQYRMARDTFSSRMDLEEALNAGTNALRMTPAAIEDTLKGLSKGEQEMFRLGAARGIVDAVQRTTDGHDVVRKLFGNKQVREALQKVFPNAQDFRRFTLLLQRETRMGMTHNAVLGNSTTARQIADLIDNRGVGQDVVNLLFSGQPIQALATGVRQAVFGEQGLSAKVADRMAEMLLSSDPDKITRALKMLAAKEGAVQRFQQRLRGIGLLGGSVAGRAAPALALE